MKRILTAVLIVLLMCGCTTGNAAYEQALGLRARLQSGGGCAFVADITADYGEYVYDFELDCVADCSGNIQFSVLSPDNIAGITGIISQSEGAITFDDKLLAFDLLADGCISPVSAPWIVMRSLLGGYIGSCTVNDSGYLIRIDDSYEEDSLKLELWTDQQMLPFRTDVMWQGRRVLAVNIKNFKIFEN